MDKVQSVPNLKENRLLYFKKKVLRIKTSESSLLTVFMRHVKIIKWPYTTAPLDKIIYGIENRFLILTWIHTVIFHSRRLVTRNMFS